MPTCQNCGNEWTWKETIKTLFRLKCPHCSERQYESAASRMRSGIFTMIGLVIFMPINILFDFSLGIAVIVGLIFIIIICAFYPFVLKLSNEQEPYW